MSTKTQRGYFDGVEAAHPRDRILLISDWRDNVTIQAHERPYNHRTELYDLNCELRKLLGLCAKALEFLGSPSVADEVYAQLQYIEQLPIMQED